MPSSLFPQKNNAGNSILDAINTFRGMTGGNPQAMYDYLYRRNPQFKQFADSMRGKTPQQAFQENGLNYDQVRSMIK